MSLRSHRSLLVPVLWALLAHGTVQAQSERRLRTIDAATRGTLTDAWVDSIVQLSYDVMSSDLATTIALQHRALSQLRRQGPSVRQGMALEILHKAHYLLGAYDSATHHALKAIDMYRAIGDKAREGGAECALAYNMKRRDLATAFEIMRQGIGKLEEADAREWLASHTNSFGVLYEMRGDLDSAYYCYARSLRIKREVGDSLGVPFSMNCLGTVEHLRGNFIESERWFRQAMEERRSRGDAFGVAEEHLYFGELYEAWGRRSDAIAAYEAALSATTALDYPRGRQQSLERLSVLYEAGGETLRALSTARAAMALKDSLLNAERERTVAELDRRYRVAEKDRAIAQLNERAARRQLVIWAVAIALFLVVVLGMLFHQWRQQRLRAERDAAIIREREAGLKAVFAATEEERKRLARELHDGVGQQLGGIKHRLEHLRSATADQALPDVIGLLDGAAREVRELAHQLMPKALSRLGLVPALRDLVKSSFDGTNVQGRFDAHGVPDVLRPELATGIYRIAQESIGNIIKHAGATHVDIQLIRNREHLVLIVHDDGIGFDATRAPGGLGIVGMADRARTAGGSFAIEGGGGTTITVRAPIETPAA
ncbi:MAG: sensor histidine kinase [Flavobacteriales bacterium]|nr:sensor histidine kinase [Flavobacteriales bacterium]